MAKFIIATQYLRILKVTILRPCQLRWRDSSTNKPPSVPHDKACGIIRLTNLTALYSSYWSLIKTWISL
jgi:hypothetical protein